MTTRTFTLTLDDGDRLMVLTALSFSSMHLMVGNADQKMRRPIDELIQRLSSANGQDAPSAPSAPSARSGTEAARAVLAPAPQDYFAQDRKGNIPLKPPTGATLQSVEILATQESVDRKHLKVTFKGGLAGSEIKSQANCFDRAVWEAIVKQKQPGRFAQLWIAEKGDYLNIVGVRA